MPENRSAERHGSHPCAKCPRATVLASIIGSGWAKAGALHWDVMDEQGKVIGSGDGEKLPVWSYAARYAARYARPDGVFLILF